MPTHFVEELSDRETVVKKVSIVPLEVIIRNISAGSFAKRYGVEEGIVFDAPTIEFSYKNDDLGDPLINDYHALALKLATWDEIDTIKKYAFAGQRLPEEDPGRSAASPWWTSSWNSARPPTAPSCWPTRSAPTPAASGTAKTGEKLDKDRFRRDLGNVEGAYQEMTRRLMGK